MPDFLKALRLGVLLPALLASFGAAASDPDECVDVDRPTPRPSCAGGFDFKVRNKCSQPMDIRVCLERADKPAWSCGVELAVKPKKESNYLVCPGSGRHKAWARSADAKTLPFPEEKGDFRRQAGAIYSMAPGESKESACQRAREFASGPCECEARSGSTGFRCRIKVESPSTEMEGQAKPFAADAFKSPPPAKGAEAQGSSKVVTGTFTTRGTNETESCAELRRMSGQPDLACTCRPAGNGVLCRGEGPMTVPERGVTDTVKDKARELMDHRDKDGTPGKPPQKSNGGMVKRG